MTIASLSQDSYHPLTNWVRNTQLLYSDGQVLLRYPRGEGFCMASAWVTLATKASVNYGKAGHVKLSTCDILACAYELCAHSQDIFGQ